MPRARRNHAIVCRLPSRSQWLVNAAVTLLAITAWAISALPVHLACQPKTGYPAHGTIIFRQNGKGNARLLTRTDAIQDGRRRRSADSRRRIIQAMLELVHEGNPDPGAEAVAHRAGVGLRTVFRLFRDIESVVAEMLVPQRQAFVECFTAPFLAEHGTDRVQELFARLIVIYEARMPLRRAAMARRYSSPSLAAGIRELDTAIDNFIRHALAETNASQHSLNMLNLVMSYDAYMRLRDTQGLTQSQTQTTLHTALLGLLGTPK